MRRALTAILVGMTLAGSALAGTFSNGLERLVAGKPAREAITVLLSLREQLDVAGMDAALSARKASLAERHEQIVTGLMNTATKSQSELLAELQSLKAEGKVNGYTPYWITNAVIVNAPVSVLRQLAARSDIAVAEVNLEVELIEPILPGKPVERNPLTEDRTPEAGIQAVRAPDVWNLLGVNGAGALVGGIDTGVYGTHQALSSRWRGNNGHPASECWLDAAGLGYTTPNDTHGHGTHTMGTMVGGAPGLEVGVAPGAQWIASNCINMGTGSAFDNAVIASFQFMADPDGNPGTVDDVPDVVQNSWGVNEGFSGYVDCDSRWWVAIDNCEASGVCVTWSAGNEGPGGTSLRSPADRALTPYNCFSVGATSAYSPYTIASFSSRGPSGCGGAFATKPEVSAPGVDTYSCYNGGATSYTTMSGTSMAGPHVAGVVALMRSANPDVDVNTIKQILMDTAVDLGSTGEDNTYGWGFIDAYEAVLAVMSGYGTLAGTVTDANTSLPLTGVLVENTAGPQQINTNASGAYSLMFPAGGYTVSYSLFGYTAQNVGVSIAEDATTTQNVALSPAPSALLYGYVYGPDSNPVVGATIDFTNAPIADVSTGAGGYYSVSIPTGHTYDLTASATGVGSLSQTITFNASQQLDFNLPVNPMYLPSGPDAYGYRIFDSHDAGGVPYEWNDIAGTQISEGDDVTQTVTVPFSFNYYSTAYTQLSIGSNGFVIPGSSASSTYTNGAIPDGNIPGAIYGMWDDLNPLSSGSVFYEYEPANGRFVVEWDAVSYFGGGGSVSFQIILLDPAVYPSESGDAQWIMYYNNGDRQSHSTGLDNATASTGIQYDFNNVYDIHATPFSNGAIALLFSTNTNGLELEDNTPPVISHTPLQNTQDTAGPYTVNATITDFAGIASATMSYRVNGGAWTAVAMTGGPLYTANIPGPRPIGTVIDYHIAATDASENANSTQTVDYTFTILAPTVLEYCQDFETGSLDDFTNVNFGSGYDWGINSFAGQGYTAYIQYTDWYTEDHAGLISPVFDCSGQATVDLDFWMHLFYGYSDYWTDAYVKLSLDGGITWPHTVAEWHAVASDPESIVEGDFSFDITALAAGEPNVRIMFEYHALYDWYWFVDDVCLTGTLANVAPEPVDLNIAYIGSDVAQLSWTAVPNATSYNIYYADAINTSYTYLANTTGTSYNVTTGAAQTKVYRVVTRHDVTAAAAQVNPVPRPLNDSEMRMTK